MEMELEPRVKPLAYKVKAMSRETTAQKAPNVLDPDLRTHWSTGTNTKEWILLELDEPCLLSHLRIYNKSVLEWEVTVGLRYKPEAFVKVRPRCEAPRRDMMYPMNYTPCRYVRISCLRGNPIAIFFIQLIGISVTGLEPEFQPVVNYLLPHIISHKQEANDMHFQLLQDVTNRLLFFLPQLETDLNSFTDAAESNMRFFAMLAGPFYPILHIAKEREASKAGLTTQDSDPFRNNQTSTLTVSSNFEAQRRRLRSSSSSIYPASSFMAFRSDAVIMLLKNAYKDPHLGIVCRIASRALQKFIQPIGSLEESIPHEDTALTSASDETAKIEAPSHYDIADYSSLFGEEFKIPDDQWDTVCLNILDIAAVEEGIFHLLFACASNPLLCCKLADSSLHFWSILPLIQALLPALRPPLSSPLDQVDNSFSQWKHHSVQLALSQIVTMSSSTIYHPLLRACAGYLSSFSSSHAKAACVLIDLCSGTLSPWIPTITAKVDLAIDLMEDLLGIIQGGQQSVARAALKYIILALSGNMDDVLAKYKENKHKLLFLVEMLEPFLDPAITAMKNTIAFGDVSAIFLEKQERTCAIALNVIRTAVQRPAVLPSLESEWRRGSVAPSVLLSILGPHMPLPSDIDRCKCSVSKAVDHEPLQMSSCINESDGKTDSSETTIKSDGYEDPNFLFASPELKKTVLTAPSNHFVGSPPDKSVELSDSTTEGKHMAENISANEFQLDNSFFLEYYNVQENYLQLVNYQDCEVRASEFQHLAMDLCSQHDSSPEGHAAAIDALLLAAECYVNPFFMISFRSNSKLIDHMATIKSKMDGSNNVKELCKDLLKSKNNLEAITHLEAKRDKTVLQILLQAAKLDRDYQMSTTQSDHYPYDPDDKEQGVDILPQDLQFADAITLVRQNQALLCHFVTQQLQREQHSSHEILLQCLLFLLHSATELSCPPEYVIDIILQSAENLNVLLSSLYCQVKEGNMHICPEKLHVVQRQWALLQKMVIASSGNDDHAPLISKTRNGFQFRCLVPPSSWMNKISSFSNNSYPLPRFLGWMAISRYAKQYLTERLFLASDLSQLTSLLCIFSDELALTDIAVNQKVKAPECFDTKHCLQWSKELGPSNHSDGQESFHVVHPDLHKFFPNMKKHFGTFGEVILEAVGLQLKCLPVSAIPDVLCWFSDLCVCPYPESVKYCHYFGNSADCLKGHMTTSAKAIVLYLLESILSAHMEAMVPEMPRAAQILISMCKASYCDVAFLDSVLHLLRPLMSYYLRKVTDVEKPPTDVFSSQDFELNFEELFDSISCRNGSQDGPGEKKIQGSLMIFTFGSLFADLTFRGKREILRSLLEWVDFTSKEPVSSFYDYLCAFQKVMDSCYIFLVQNLNALGIIIPFERNKSLGSDVGSLGGNSNLPSELQDKAAQSLPFTPALEFDSNDGASLLVKGIHYLSVDEIQEISEGLEALIFKLIAAIEASWKLHSQLASKLTTKSAECLLFSKCLNSISQAGNISQSSDGSSNIPSIPSDLSSKHWVYALEGLTGAIITSQQNQCWQVSSAILDYQLSLPRAISLDCVICSICSAIKHFILHAPRISWRLQTDKWLSCLFTRGISNLGGNETSLVDLFCTMLGHPEPEQRAVALQHLGRIVGLDTSPGVPKLSYTFHQSSIGADSALSISESLVSFLVLNTWDRVAALALSDSSMLLKSHAIALLSGYIPFAERSQLQSFFVTTNTILRGMGRLSPSMEEGHLSRLSLGLLASMCLYSPSEDVALIPESVWRNLESMGMPRTGDLDDSERKLCKALCKLRTESDSAKTDLKEALSLHSAEKDSDPNFRSTRESILQVLSSLISIQSYFDFFSTKMDQESQELEEAEIEVDLLQKERALHEISSGSIEEMSSNLPFEKNNDCLRQIKDEIQSLERSKLREEILVRRQKKLLMRQARQKYLEEAASREMELLQELDRERTNELEHELERQKLLELERAKSRELQFNLDMEKERQTQRELQRELEQLESGVRSSRREFSSNPSSRTRDRYRERDIGRPGNEGSLRPSSRGRESGTPQTATSGPGTTSAPTVVLSGSRSFSGHLPTILQSRDRADERSTSYEDSFEGGRDSGDASSIGDPDLASAFDGLGGGFGSAPRHGSRGSKSRQVVERRERDGRREGKWERKNS